VPSELRSWSATRVLYPARDPKDDVAVESILALPPDQHELATGTWDEALASHFLTRRMTALFASGDIDEFLEERQVALERQLYIFLQQRCEWAFEDTPSLDLLVIDDDDEARELSDDESSRY
jgi:hypothetical protein